MKTLFVPMLILCTHLLSAQPYKKIREKAIVVDTHNFVLTKVMNMGINNWDWISGLMFWDSKNFHSQYLEK